MRIEVHLVAGKALRVLKLDWPAILRVQKAPAFSIESPASLVVAAQVERGQQAKHVRFESALRIFFLGFEYLEVDLQRDQHNLAEGLRHPVRPVDEGVLCLH